MHSLVPTCGVPEYPQNKFGLDDNHDDYELWFRNTPHAVMELVRQLMLHSLEAWDDCLSEFAGLTSDSERERLMLSIVEGFRPLGSDLSAEVIRITTAGTRSA